MLVKYNKSNPDVKIFKVGEKVKIISHLISNAGDGFPKKIGSSI